MNFRYPSTASINMGIPNPIPMPRAILSLLGESLLFAGLPADVVEEMGLVNAVELLPNCVVVDGPGFCIDVAVASAVEHLPLFPSPKAMIASSESTDEPPQRLHMATMDCTESARIWQPQL